MKEIARGADSGVPSEEDRRVIAAFREWLEDPLSRCIICLNAEPSVKVWKDHPTRGRVWMCASHQSIGSE